MPHVTSLTPSGFAFGVSSDEVCNSKEPFMVFGFAISLTALAIGGATMLALLLFQMATGMRWIKLPAKRRLKIHKATGITLLALALVHGSMGLILASGAVIG
jgi:hypothetical protein